MIIKNLLQRYSDNKESTLGLWFMDGKFDGYTLEDEARTVKVSGETRIPAGVYELRLREVMSQMTEKYRAKYPWFTWHIEIMAVPGFQYVYVHIGNIDDDTDACILRGDTTNNNNVSTGFIGQSVPSFERWYKRMQPHLASGGQAYLTIRDEDRLFTEAA